MVIQNLQPVHAILDFRSNGQHDDWDVARPIVEPDAAEDDEFFDGSPVFFSGAVHI